jgi:hypothetical protein
MKISGAVHTAQALFYLNAAIWMIFSVVTMGYIQYDPPVPIMVQWVIAVLMVGNAGAMAFSGYFLSKKARWSYLLAVIVLSINIILTVTDQVGIFDWITLLIDLVLMIILLTLRKEYG